MKPRRHIVADYLGRWQRETRASWGTIATNVREIYHHMVGEHDRLVLFSNHTDVHQRQRLDAQVLRRHLDADEGLHSDLEEACIIALPDKYRQDCINQINHRLGQHSGPMLGDEVPAFESMAHISHDFSSVVDSLVPVLADGKLNPSDAPYVPAVRVAIQSLQGKLTSLQRELDSRVINHNVTELRT